MAARSGPGRVLLQPEEAGALIAADRPWPSWLAWAFVPVAGGLVGLLAVPNGGFGGWLTVFLAIVVALALFYSCAIIEKHRVHERAVLLGPTVGRAVPYVVAVESIDPASVRYRKRANFYRPPGVELGSWVLRIGPYHTQAVTFEGLVPDLAHPNRRAMADIDIGRALATGGELPTTVWILGTRNAGTLLRALEEALVRSGRDDAVGLADRELAHPTVHRWPGLPRIGRWSSRA